MTPSTAGRGTGSEARPTLVFLHGTAGPKKKSKWLAALSSRLEDEGLSGWRPEEVVAVDYRQPLQAKRRRHARPPSRSVELTPARRRVVKARRKQLQRALRGHRFRGGAAVRRLPASTFRGPAIALRRVRKDFRRTAARYLRVRGQVISHVLDRLPDGDLIIIGYSLGSVVAVDLLPHLREGQRVRLLLTWGSPLGVEGCGRPPRAGSHRSRRTASTPG